MAQLSPNPLNSKHAGYFNCFKQPKSSIIASMFMFVIKFLLGGRQMSPPPQKKIVSGISETAIWQPYRCVNLLCNKLVTKLITKGWPITRLPDKMFSVFLSTTVHGDCTWMLLSGNHSILSGHHQVLSSWLIYVHVFLNPVLQSHFSSDIYTEDI